MMGERVSETAIPVIEGHQAGDGREKNSEVTGEKSTSQVADSDSSRSNEDDNQLTEFENKVLEWIMTELSSRLMDKCPSENEIRSMLLMVRNRDLNKRLSKFTIETAIMSISVDGEPFVDSVIEVLHNKNVPYSNSSHMTDQPGRRRYGKVRR